MTKNNEFCKPTQGVGMQTPTGAKTEYPEMFNRFFEQSDTFQTDNLLNAYKNDMQRCIINIAVLISKQMFEKDVAKVLHSVLDIVSLCYHDLSQLEEENLKYCFAGKETHG
jgi:hypothetical protein